MLGAWGFGTEAPGDTAGREVARTGGRLTKVTVSARTGIASGCANERPASGITTGDSVAGAVRARAGWGAGAAVRGWSSGGAACG